jgi:hypothetical protein
MAKKIHRLARRAMASTHDSRVTNQKSMCQLAQRQVVGLEYGASLGKWRGGTASIAAHDWAKTDYARPGGNWGKVGDIYYWFATPEQPEGHTAIRIPDNKVWENSVVHYRRTGKGKGTRKLSELSGYPDMIVRLPE